ncbi:MAG: endonuclease III [Candidatus Aureabacteria bacterium]|jgi:endonuclease-3|nr:endonuclease III [Candidatus Auribacterota bacterium]NLW94510.1 endonuclease III [Chlamydiota bacterium]HOE26175.1 endonuclease III [bacterium]HQM51975.1 endonuclease III [bacterium]
MRSARGRIGEIVAILRENYPESRTALRHEDPFQLLVATILSAQCTDARVNMVTPSLFGKYPTAAHFARAKQAILEKEIRSTGFFRNKARNIIGAAKHIVAEHGGNVPDTMEELVALPGVARKTANIVLSSAYGKAEGIAVDTHVRRLSRRLGLSAEEDPVKIERDLMAIVPKGDWLDFNHLLVNHGRAICRAKKPRCPDCPLKRLCPSATKFFPEL